MDKLLSAAEAVTGVRPTISEADKREREIMAKIYSLKGQQEELYQYLRTIERPRKAIAGYNAKVEEILNSPLVPKELSEEWRPKLMIDLDRYLQSKAHTASLDVKTKNGIKRSEGAVKLLKNFDISPEQAKKLLAEYYARERKSIVTNPLERDRVLGRARKRRRLNERMTKE